MMVGKIKSEIASLRLMADYDRVPGGALDPAWCEGGWGLCCYCKRETPLSKNATVLPHPLPGETLLCQGSGGIPLAEEAHCRHCHDYAYVNEMDGRFLYHTSDTMGDVCKGTGELLYR